MNECKTIRQVWQQEQRREMGRKRTVFEVQLSGNGAKKPDLPREVAESCRRSLGALKAALDSGAFERAIKGNAVANSASASRAR